MATFQSASSSGWVTVSPLSINKPSGTADGDLLVMIIANSNSAMTVATPSGWTLLSRKQSSASNITINTFWKIASSEPSSYTIAQAETVGAILRISGFEVSSPVDTFASDEVSNSANPVFTNGDITPSISDSLLLFIAVCNNVNVPTGISNYAIVTSNPSWTEQAQLQSSTYGILAVATASRPQTTSTGDPSCTLDNGSSSTDSACMMVAIKRQISFSADILDNLSVSDITPVVSRNILVNILDTILTSDSISALKEIWSSVSKSIDTWIDTPKN